MPFTGELSALACAVIWAVTAFIYKRASDAMNPLQVNALRLAAALVYFLIAAFAVLGGVTLSIEQIVILFVSGIVGMTLGDTFIFKAYELMGARRTSVLLTVNPALAALLAFAVTGEGMTLTAVGGMAVTLIGISVVLLEKHEGEKLFAVISKRGLAFCLISSLLNAAQLIMTKYAASLGPTDGLNSGIEASFFRTLAAFVFVFPTAAFMRKELSLAKTVRKQKNLTIKLFAASFFGTFLGVTLSYFAVTNTEIGIVSTLMSTTPVLMIPIARFWVKEKITVGSAVGAVIAVGGVALLFWK